MLREKNEKPIGTIAVGKLVEMFKGWIEDPEAWAALQQDR